MTMNKLQTQPLVLALTLFFSSYAMPSFSESLPSGDEIAANINARDEGVAVSRLLRMTMTDRRGKTRIRETKTFRKYYGQEKRTAIFYLSPKNVKDTAFLTYDYPDADKNDDQWLYLPAMRRVRRISASDRGDYFLGTDFTYEDIKLETRYSTKDYTRQTLGKELIDGKECILTESTAINKKVAKELGHNRREDCITPDNWMPIRSVFWDIKGNPLKTTTYSDIRKVQGIWTTHIIEVVNHKTKHATRFEFSNVNYTSGVDDEIFSQATIQRGI